MTTPAQEQAESQNAATRLETSTGWSALGFAIIGCEAAGVVGIFKACEMSQALDVLLCLLGSVISFGVVCFIYLRRK